MQASRKHIYFSEKAPIYMLPGSKAPKCSKLGVTKIREKPVDFYYGTARGVGFSSRNNFTNLGSLAKVSVPVESIIF